MKHLLLALFFLSTSVQAQFQVGERTITYNDPARSNRAIECEIYYPAVSGGSNVTIASGEFPVIVFGHGFAMQVGAYPNFWNQYVPQGYIMVFPTTEGGTIFPPPNHGDFGADLRFLVNELESEGTNNQSPFFNRINGKFAIMGHSMGGGATFLGASNFSNVDCIVGLAPAETDPSAVAAAANVSAPTLVFSGTSDGVTPPAEHHIPIYDATGASCKYFVNIQDGSHCYFASNTFTCTLGEIIPGSLDAEAQRQVTYAVLTPWFDYFLKEDCDAWDDFQTALSSESNLGTINSVCSNESPIIVNNSGTLESDVQSNYQWYQNGAPINGETQQTLDYTQSGMYQVATINLGNCEVLSNQINVQITGVELVKVNVSVLTESQIRLNMSPAITDPVFNWFDISGRLIASERHSGTSVNFNLNVPDYEGIKLLQIQSSQFSKTLKIQ